MIKSDDPVAMYGPTVPLAIESPPPAAELKVARISARAAMGGAVIALVAAIAGAAIGGYFTNLAADKQIAGSSTQSRSDFLRAQKQAAYATVIADDYQLEQAESSVTTISTTTKPSDAVAILRKVEDLEVKLSQDVGNVELVGSADVRAAANKLLYAELDTFPSFEERYNSALTGGKDRWPLMTGRSGSKLDTSDTGHSMAEFWAAARADLHS